MAVPLNIPNVVPGSRRVVVSGCAIEYPPMLPLVPGG